MFFLQGETQLSKELMTITREIQALRKEIAHTMPDNPVLSGWSAYSQCDEDGIIRECLRRIEKTIDLSRTFVEIGCADGLENNTHALLLDGFRGVWVDGDSKKIASIHEALNGTLFEKLWVVEEMVSLESVNLLAQRAKQFFGVESLDFLSLDIDGNDWHVLPAALETLNPKMVCVEYNAKFPPPMLKVMPYNKAHVWEDDDYFGASLQSWIEMMAIYTYSLVCCNLSGANAFFVRNDLLEGFSIYTSVALYQPARYFLMASLNNHPPSLKWVKQAIYENKTPVSFVKTNIPTIPFFNFAIHTGNDQFISRAIAHDGVWEPFETMIFTRLCKQGDIVLDLGANIGWYSVLAAKLVSESGRVFAFEPDKMNARLLQMNAAVSDKQRVIDLYQTAVGDQETEATFYKSDSNLGDHRLFSDGSSREKDSVYVTTLDAFFSDKQEMLPHILKSDTQGYEAKILRGAKDLFSKGWRPIMILEFWPFGLTQSGDDPLHLWRTLVKMDYVIFELAEGNPQLIPITEERLLERLVGDISPSAEGFINLLCFPNKSERLKDVADLIQRSEELPIKSNLHKQTYLVRGINKMMRRVVGNLC